MRIEATLTRPVDGDTQIALCKNASGDTAGT